MDFFGFFKNKKNTSKNAAKDRLQFVLIHDRANVSPELLEMMKGELLEVLSRYVEINQDEFDMRLTNVDSEDGQRKVPALVANIPIVQMKRAEEVKQNGSKK